MSDESLGLNLAHMVYGSIPSVTGGMLVGGTKGVRQQ